MDIANASGATVRADINTGLVAIAENNSGASEPSTTFAYQLWADTTTGYMKIRNAANSGWIIGFQLSTFGMIVGADIASAAALPVLADGQFNDVTGTTTITSINALGIGSLKWLQFDGALTVTHHATNLVLPSGNNITTVAGQILGFYEYAAGDWRLISNSIPSTGSGGVRNLLINGGMSVAQRGTSFTSATTPANSDDTYLLDRWILLSDGNDIVDVTQQADGGVSGKEDYIRLDVETAQKKFGILQVIESRNLKNVLSGTDSVSLSAELKVTNATKMSDIRMAVFAWDSTADSVTSDIVSAWAAEGSVITPVANWTAENVAASLGVTTSWVKYTIEGISIDTASVENLAVFIYQNNVATNDTTGVFLEVTNVQLEAGATANTFDYRKINDEWQLCKRYYEEYNQNGSTNYHFGGRGQAISGTAAETTWQWEVEKRTDPSVSISAAGDFDLIAAAGGSVAVTSFSFNIMDRFNARASLGVASGLAAGDATYTRDGENGLSRVKVDSEL